VAIGYLFIAELVARQLNNGVVALANRLLELIQVMHLLVFAPQKRELPTAAATGAGAALAKTRPTLSAARLVSGAALAKYFR